MRWDDFRQSSNVEDRRGMGVGGAGGIGIGTIIVLGLIGWALGIDPRLLIGGAEVLTRGQQEQAEPGKQGVPDDETGRFVAAVLGDTEDRWTEIFREAGRQYAAPRLIMFSGATQSACGMAQAAMGPFYCPEDRAVYLDTAFFRDLETRFGGCDGKACRFA
jgi:uncharacterized protein